MFDKFIIVFLFIFSFIYFKYIPKKYKEMTKIAELKKLKRPSENEFVTIILKKEVFRITTFMYFLVPLYILIIAALSIFWQTENIDKILTVILLILLMLLSVVYVLIILRWKIVLKEDYFEYSTLIKTKKIYYIGLSIKYKNNGDRIVYKNEKKVLSLLNCYTLNGQYLIDKIQKINGFECIKI